MKSRESTSFSGESTLINLIIRPPFQTTATAGLKIAADLGAMGMLLTLTGRFIKPTTGPVQRLDGAVIFRHLIIGHINFPLHLELVGQFIPPSFTQLIFRRKNKRRIANMPTTNTTALAIGNNWERHGPEKQKDYQPKKLGRK
jgi:hypothetical protein